MSEPQITTAETEEKLSLLAKEFATLLASSDLDDEIQTTLINLLPFMEPHEILNVVSSLEAKYTNSATSHLDDFLEYELKDTLNKFNYRQEARNRELIQKLNQLAKRIVG